MNRLLLAASKSAAPSLRDGHRRGSVASATLFRLVATRPFSDAAESAVEPPPPTAAPANDDGGDAEVKVGKVRWVDYNKNYGLIVPDGVDFSNHDKKDLFFVHGSNIKRKEAALNKWIGQLGLHRGLRVQFKCAPPTEGRGLRAYDVTLENGDLLETYNRPRQKTERKRRPSAGGVEDFVGAQHRLLGKAVMEIFDSSQDPQELENRLVEAYEKAKDNIYRHATKQARNGGEGTGGGGKGEE